MVPMIDTQRIRRSAAAHGVLWRGRSGRLLTLTFDDLEEFTLSETELAVMARGSLVLWAGNARDIVEDHASRGRFRLALAAADRVFAIAAPADQTERLTLIWDIEGASPFVGSAATW